MLCTLREADFKRRAFINKRLVITAPGFVFADSSEVTTFHDHIQNNVAANEPRPPPTPPTRNTSRKTSRTLRKSNRRRITRPTHRPPPLAGQPSLPQNGGPLLPRETYSRTPIVDLYRHLEKEVVTEDMHFSKDLIRNYSERQQLPANRLKQLPPPPTPRTRPQNPRPPSPPHRPHSISSDMTISSPTIPPHYSSSVNSTVTSIHQQKTPGNRAVDLPFPTITEFSYSCEHYSSVYCSARSPFTFFSMSKFSGRPHLRPSFYLIPFQQIGRFPHP